MSELQKENKNYSYLIDNASIHKSKKAMNMYKEHKLNVIFNAPYQSKFILSMVFSLLRKKLNKNIVKTEKDIRETIKTFIKDTKTETLTNIFRHSIKSLEKYIQEGVKNNTV